MGIDDILIVCALKEETQNKLDGYDVLYTGVGKVNATYSLTNRLLKNRVKVRDKYFGLPKLVINYGSAGSKDIPIHTLVDCVRFAQRDMDATPLGCFKGETPFDNYTPPSVIDFETINPIGKKYVCGTGDNFVQDVSNEMSMIDVFDMEAYALAKVCFNMNVDFISFKYITDNVNEKSADDWEKNCSKGIDEFKKILKEIV